MEILIYLLVLLTSFLGVIAGLLLSKIALEEIYAISKHLRYVNVIIVTTMVFMATTHIGIGYSTILAAITFFLLFLFRNKYEHTWIYSSCGAILYVSTLMGEILSVSILIFIYGLNVSSIEISNSISNKDFRNKQTKFVENPNILKHILLKYAYYLIVGISFYVLFSIVM
ncbi:MAG: hypothetical protein ACP5OA_01315 [Candidatus Woesearchaeota archaeon]